MLHAQCTINPSRGILTQGDVLLLALPDRPWGRLDRKMLLVVEWEDAEMEQRLLDRRRAGEAHPVITLPYARRDAKGKTIKMSTRAVDCTLLTPAILDKSKTEPAPVLKTVDYAVRVAPAEIEPEPKGIVATVVDAIVSAWNWVVG